MLSLAIALAVTSLQDVPEPLQPLKFLIGTWAGQGKLSSGEAYSDEHRFEWMHGEQFMRSEYVLRVDDKPRWSSTSIIGFDSEKKRLVAFVFAQNGGIARSECVSGDRKDAWVFEGRAVARGTVTEDRVTHAKVDEDTFSIRVEIKKDGKFSTSGTSVYKRKKG